ncbi:MAG: PaaI family thioesterase [Rhabdaerophilum sp.]
MPDPVFQRISDSFSKQGLMQLLGARLSEVEAGRVMIAMPFSASITQQHGFAHAGAITSIVDSACGYAALTLMPEGKAVLTSEFKINLLAPAAGEIFEAEGRIIRAGKRVHVAMGEAFAVQNGQRKPIAIMLATMMVIDAETGLSG